LALEPKLIFSCFISDKVPDLQGPAKVQCFPLYLFSGEGETSSEVAGLFERERNTVGVRRDAITDEGLAHFQSAFHEEVISKEDLFYYIYGILHSPDYRERYADNLSKELPRIPRVRSAADFLAFSKAGRALAELHLNYEAADKYPLTIETKGSLTDADYRVEKMKFAKKKDPESGKSVDDRSAVIYNTKITLSGIPEAAWGYVVNGKAALDWVMERQAVRTDKDSGIVNDANDWAVETVGNPKYPLELFQRVVTVSLETQKIVASLPVLDVRDDG
jgi:predicted helicase